jgi:uncharacterized protein (TIGR02611 family)
MAMTQPQATPDHATPEQDELAAPAAPREHRLHAARVRLGVFRAKIRARPALNLAYRIAIGVVGTAVLVLGVLAIPYPGPGWLIVFAGLGLLATEFTWAGRVLHVARGCYDRWSAWVVRQNRVVQLLLGLVSLAVVLAMLWLLGALWFAAGLVGLEHWTWLQSPIIS